MSRITPELFRLLMDVQYADAMAQSEYRRKEKLERIEKVRRVSRKILEENQCLSLKDLKLKGQDVVDLGASPGPVIGEVLKAALYEVLEEPSRNDPEILKKFARGYLERI